MNRTPYKLRQVTGQMTCIYQPAIIIQNIQPKFFLNLQTNLQPSRKAMTNKRQLAGNSGWLIFFHHMHARQCKTVLRTTYFSQGNMQISTPITFKSLSPIDMKLCLVDKSAISQKLSSLVEVRLPGAARQLRTAYGFCNFFSVFYFIPRSTDHTIQPFIKPHGSNYAVWRIKRRLLGVQLLGISASG